MATFQPSPSLPIMQEAGIRASLKKVWQKPYSPVSFLMGRGSMPSACIGAKKKLRPAYLFGPSVDVRAIKIMYLA
jgi:hypothetical protein